MDAELGLLPEQIQDILSAVYAERYGDDRCRVGGKKRMRLWDDMLRREWDVKAMTGRCVGEMDLEGESDDGGEYACGDLVKAWMERVDDDYEGELQMWE